MTLQKLDGYSLMSEIQKKGKTFTDAIISNVSINNLKFTGLTFRNCIFREVDFGNNSFSACTFSQCNFYACKIEENSFIQSQIHLTDFLEGSTFKYNDFTSSRVAFNTFWEDTTQIGTTGRLTEFEDNKNLLISEKVEDRPKNCRHEWVEVAGFTAIYIDCKHCGSKKE